MASRALCVSTAGARPDATYRSVRLMLDAIGILGILVILVLSITLSLGYLVVRAVRADLSARRKHRS